VYGVAQPTVPGLKSILTLLSCQPQQEEPKSEVETTGRRRSSVALCEQGHTIWFSTREETLGESCLLIRDKDQAGADIAVYMLVAHPRLN
jgi:hypothetical protein